MRTCARTLRLDAVPLASILNHMVKHQDEALDRTFAALSDPTRRALLARLGEQDGLSVSELAAPFPVSLPAIMKHLDVLTDAGLIVREKTGRTVACRLTARPMEQAMNWLNRYAQFWSHNLDRLAAFVEEETWPTQPPTPPNAQQSVQASRSRAGSARRRQRSTPPGRKPRS
ncbi:transcriptional regulator [Bradyrhizobium forestalis]|uniref:Transcriptional regulator n=2 Tax=Bradyrhizobium forestalis TaxID=1419263 RepID=A0A2M8QY28_9BRAD|nr:transcriptional regulator [Bradyrhizobium forestalis]